MTPKPPLAKISVLELSRVLAGPWCAQTLADLGADVVKVEHPGAGDDTRAWGPPYLRDENGDDTSESAYFLATNRNKRSIALDFSKPRGRDVLISLVEKSDILIENFRVGGLAKYQLDYATLNSINPRLIYCSITGFGQTGPERDRGGYDYMIQGMAGLMSVTGQPDGTPGAEPMKVGVALTDVMTGLYATIAILGALEARRQTGRGQHIDMALFDVQVATLANQGLNYLTTGTSPARLGNAHPNVVPYQVFTTSDGYMILAVGNDKQFVQACAVMGRNDLSGDPRFTRNRDRIYHRAPLIAAMTETIKTRTTSDWLSAFNAAGVPCGPINTIGEAFSEPQALARNLSFSLPHAFGTAPTIASPIRLSETPVAYERGPPLLGQHTEEILREMGLRAKEIDDLISSGVIAAPKEP